MNLRRGHAQSLGRRILSRWHSANPCAQLFSHARGHEETYTLTL